MSERKSTDPKADETPAKKVPLDDAETEGVVGGGLNPRDPRAPDNWQNSHYRYPKGHTGDGD